MRPVRPTYTNPSREPVQYATVSHRLVPEWGRAEPRGVAASHAATQLIPCYLCPFAPLLLGSVASELGTLHHHASLAGLSVQVFICSFLWQVDFVCFVSFCFSSQNFWLILFADPCMAQFLTFLPTISRMWSGRGTRWISYICHCGSVSSFLWNVTIWND